MGVLPVASGFRVLNSKLRHAHHDWTQTPLNISIGSPAGTNKLEGTFHSENSKSAAAKHTLFYESLQVFPEGSVPLYQPAFAPLASAQTQGGASVLQVDRSEAASGLESSLKKGLTLGVKKRQFNTFSRQTVSLLVS